MSSRPLDIERLSDKYMLTERPIGDDVLLSGSYNYHSTPDRRSGEGYVMDAHIARWQAQGYVIVSLAFSGYENSRYNVVMRRAPCSPS